MGPCFVKGNNRRPDQADSGISGDSRCGHFFLLPPSLTGGWTDPPILLEAQIVVNLYQKEYSFPFGPPPMNPSEQQFLDALAQLGGSAGHGALRQKLGWNQPTYDQIQTTQKDQGKILPGRGRLAETPDLFGVFGADPAGKSRPVSPATPKESGRQPKAAPSTSSATIGFEAKLWLTAEIAAPGHVLTPGRYVGAEEVEDDGDPFEEKMPRLVAELHAQFAESEKIEALIKRNLEGLGYGL